MWFLDCKEQKEFQYDSGQITEWLLGIADIKEWTQLLQWCTNDLSKADLCTQKKDIKEVW